MAQFRFGFTPNPTIACPTSRPRAAYAKQHVMQDDHTSGHKPLGMAEKPILQRTIALVGLMGAGKSSVGRRLAAALGVTFRDADDEIEKAARQTVAEIFAEHGEAEFRRGERRVIARLLEQPPHILATGGGAFMDLETRALMAERATTIWLRADLDTLMRRVSRRDDRPLLKTPNPRATMQALMDARYPVYAEANIVVDSRDGPHSSAVDAIIAALKGPLSDH